MSVTLKIYKLEGRSLDAAQQLEAIVTDHFKKDPIRFEGRNIVDINTEARERSEKLIADLEKSHPDLLKATGLSTPVISVRQERDGWPRAYLTWPDIYSTPTQNPSYYMYVPAGYDGNQFKPEDAVEIIGAKKKARLRSVLFADGWLDNPPILARAEKGTALPDDFSLSKSVVYKTDNNPKDMTISAYKTHGRSGYYVRSYLEQKNSDSALTLDRYWMLKNPTAPQRLKDEFSFWSRNDIATPQLHTFGDDHYLTYIVERGKKDHSWPPDALPVSTSTFLWLKANDEDLRRGIKPPPAPMPVLREMALIRRAEKDRDPELPVIRL